MKNIIIASTSTIHDSDYLEYLLEELALFFNNVSTILFIPYARPGGISHDEYTQKVRVAFLKINKQITGIHTFKNLTEAINNAEAIFVGGGNTFVLVSQLHRNKLLSIIKEVVENGTPYLGTSAGSNICGLTMNTTNDMPIIQPPSFKTLGLVPFNINPHYLDPIPNSTHKGETRETRIKEFHAYNSQPVVGLREGSWLEVLGNTITLKGKLPARIFEHNQTPYEVDTNTDLSDLK
ncbi:dipeptidase PepE [Lacinutrix himadriensis]|uniref:dipeptidase PepE n=1 Tax=Lacinutrix himadriensis TaxID=641549 RepID=UPI0006E19203|nr:dipeptidase PepE [Lacinutrix himadriensis]